MSKSLFILSNELTLECFSLMQTNTHQHASNSSTPSFSSKPSCNPTLGTFRLTIPMHVDSATEELTLDLSNPW